MSFASATGDFTSFNGLSPFFTESLSSTGLDIEDAATEAVDLAATSVTAPTTADVGQSITVNWQATDQSSQAATGSWQDSVYLSATPTITSSSTLLGTVPENIDSGWRGLVQRQLDGGLARRSGTWVLLRSRAGRQSLPTARPQPGQQYPRRHDRTARRRSSGPDARHALCRFLHAPPIRITTTRSPCRPADRSTSSLQSSASSGAAALYISQGTLPTPYNYQEAAATANQPNQTAVVPQVLTAGTYYILAHSVSGAAATAGFTLTATQTAAVSVSAISPYSGGNAGNVTVEIDGTNFTPAATASLTLGGTTINASSIDFVNASQISPPST